MNKFQAFKRKINWFYIFLINKDIISIISSLLLLLGRKPILRDRIIKTGNNKYFVRGGTTDYLYVYDSWEKETLILIKSLKPDIFINIGACIGEWPVKLSNLGIEFHLFEPNKSSYNSAKINALLNNVEINIYNFCLGNAHKNVNLIQNTINTGSSYIVEENGALENEKKNFIKMRKLDDFLENIFSNTSKKYLLFMDAEGYELEILKGANQILKQNIDLKIITECHNQNQLNHIKDELSEFEYQRICKDNFYFYKPQLS